MGWWSNNNMRLIQETQNIGFLLRFHQYPYDPSISRISMRFLSRCCPRKT